ncbi:MAG: DoxX family protein [Verrucomicrobium sp.]
MNTTSTSPTVLASNSNAESSSVVRTLTNAVLGTDKAFAPVVLRVALAAVVFPHGAQKLLGWFGGYGYEGTMGFFTSTMGIPWILALGVILTEFFAPLFLLAGAAVRPAAIAIGTVLATAMLKVHVANGFFMNWMGTQKGEGIEYFLLVIGIAVALVVSGAGRFSVDRALSKKA